MSGFVNAVMDQATRDAHAVIITKFEQGLASPSHKSDTMKLLELIEDIKIDSEKGLVVVVSEEPNFQKRRGSFNQVFRPTSYSVDVKPDPASLIIAIDERSLRNDRYQVQAQSAENCGRAVAERRGLFCRQNLRLGLTAKGPGGQTFWSTTQYVDPSKGAAGGTYSNKFALALNETNYETLYSAMQKTLREDGETIRGLSPTHLLVAPNLRATGRKIIGLPGNQGAEDNPNYDPTMKLVVIPELLDGEWVLATNDGTTKPLGYGFTLPPQMRWIGSQITNAYETELIWKGEVEDAMVFIAPHKMFYSKAP